MIEHKSGEVIKKVGMFWCRFVPKIGIGFVSVLSRCITMKYITLGLVCDAYLVDVTPLETNCLLVHRKLHTQNSHLH